MDTSTTSTLLLSTISYNVQIIVVIGLVAVLLALIDFIRRFVQFGKKSRYE